MEQKEKITSLQELIDWIDNSDICYVADNGETAFVVHAPNDAEWTIQFEKDDDIDTIIPKTIRQLEEFDADNEFMELWSVEFANHNHFKPSQFIKMLQEDEKSFRELADKLREMKYQLIKL
jgi:hypothetical protein